MIDFDLFFAMSQEGGYAGNYALSNETVLLALSYFISTVSTNQWESNGLPIDELQLSFVEDWQAQAILELMTQVSTVTIGTIITSALATPPTGFLLCDGSEYDEVDYPQLYALIDDAFKDTGNETFTVPDLRGRTVIGAGQGSGLTNRPMASVTGSEGVALTVGQLPEHNHKLVDGQPSLRVYAPATGTVVPPLPPYYDDNANFDTIAGSSDVIGWDNTAVAGQNQEHGNMQPSTALNYFIKAVG